MDNRISNDRTGWEFRIDGELIVGQVDSGPDRADFEWFVRSLCDLEADNPDWYVSFPEKYRGQNGHYVDGARFMSVENPEGSFTNMEFTYRRLPWKFVRSVETRYEKGQRQGQLSEPPDTSLDEDGQRQGRHTRKRKGQGRARRHSQVA